MATTTTTTVKEWNDHLAAFIKSLEQEQVIRNPDSKIRFTYRKAAKALAEAPIRITTHAEATKLKGVGPMIAGRLEAYITSTLMPEMGGSFVNEGQGGGGGGGGGGREGREEALQVQQQDDDELGDLMGDLAMASQSSFYMSQSQESHALPASGGGGGGGERKQQKPPRPKQPRKKKGESAAATAATIDIEEKENKEKASLNEPKRGAAVAAAAAVAAKATVSEVVVIDSDAEEEEAQTTQTHTHTHILDDDDDDEYLLLDPLLDSPAKKRPPSASSKKKKPRTATATTAQPKKKQQHHIDDDRDIVSLLSSSDEEEDEREDQHLGGGGGAAAAAASPDTKRTTTPPTPSSITSSAGKGRKRKLPSPSTLLSSSLTLPPLPPTTARGGGGGGGAAAARGATAAARGATAAAAAAAVPSSSSLSASLSAAMQQEGEIEEEEEEEEDTPLGPESLDHLFAHFTHTHTKEEEWEVMLLLDVREHNNNARILSLLLQHDVRCEARQLSLGDVLWVARKKNTSTHTHTHTHTQAEGEEQQQSQQQPPSAPKHKEKEDDEIMLRYVIERKTARDLASSIVDGRYTEQKGRMLGVGREVDRAFYLVEGKLHHQEGMQPATLRAALSSTHILHGIHVLHTDCLEQTIALLRKMHTRLQHSFATFLHAARTGTREVKHTYIHTHLPTLPLPPSRIIPFHDYQDKCRKSTRAAGGALTIKGLFIQQLCALPGISAAKAEAIASVFPTPVALVRGLVGMEGGEEDAVGLLAELPVPGQLKKFGQKNARVVWRVYVGE